MLILFLRVEIWVAVSSDNPTILERFTLERFTHYDAFNKSMSLGSPNPTFFSETSIDYKLRLLKGLRSFPARQPNPRW
jgi:hypothetical protein